MLEQERDKAMAQEQAAATGRSQAEGNAVRAENERLRREHEAQRASLASQNHAATTATLQGQRTQNWGTQLIGQYQPVQPTSPPRHHWFTFGGK